MEAVPKTGRSLAGGSSVEHISENISEHIIHITTLKVVFLIPTVSGKTATTETTTAKTIAAKSGSVRSGSTKATSIESTMETTGAVTAGSIGSTALVKCSVTKLVIKFLFLRITQDIVSFCDLFKFLFGLFITGIRIRVILFSKLSVGFFYR